MLTEDKIREIIISETVQKGIEKYSFLMNKIRKVDVSKDEEFQRTFRNFYQMRRFYSEDFAWHYFHLMEQEKLLGENLSFKMVLERVLHIQGSYEISFSSKLLHTINPFMPIWDSIVTKNHFGICAPYVGTKDRMKAIVQRYAQYEDKFYDFMATKEGRQIIDIFNAEYPNCNISNVKKIDFVLWQDR